MDWSQPVSNKLRNAGQSSSDFDWSQPVSDKLTKNGPVSSDVDWSKPVSTKFGGYGQTSSDFDWSQPVSSKLTGNELGSSEIDWSQPVSTKFGGNGQSSSDFDWSQPISSKLADNEGSNSGIDWSRPVSNALGDSGYTSDKLNGIGHDSPQYPVNGNLPGKQTSTAFDWSQPVAAFGGTGGLDTSSRTKYNNHNSATVHSVNSSNEINQLNAIENNQENLRELLLSENERPNEDSNAFNCDSKETQNNDAISQRLKFRACLKLVVEELCTLPHHCEIHNKDLRSTFTAWLKKELDLIHRICDFKRDVTQGESLLPLRVSTPTAVEKGIVFLKPLKCSET